MGIDKCQKINLLGKGGKGVVTKYLAIVNHVLITFWKDVEMQPCMQIDLELTIKIRSSKLVECGCHKLAFFWG